MKFFSNLLIIALFATFFTFTSFNDLSVTSNQGVVSFIKIRGGLRKRITGAFGSCCSCRSGSCGSSSGDEEDEGSPSDNMVIGDPTDFVHLSSGNNIIRGPDGKIVQNSGSDVNNDGEVYDTRL